MAGVEESSLQRNLRVLSIDERRKHGRCLACAQHPEKQGHDPECPGEVEPAPRRRRRR